MTPDCSTCQFYHKSFQMDESPKHYSLWRWIKQDLRKIRDGVCMFNPKWESVLLPHVCGQYKEIKP